MLRKAAPLIALLMVVAAAPAAQAKAKAKATAPVITPYAVTAAKGTVTLAFHGEPGAGCAAHGLCSTTGLQVYAFSGGGGGTGSAAIYLQSKRDGFGEGTFSVTARTDTLVRTPGAPDCIDSSLRRTESFSIGTPSRSGRVPVVLGSPTAALPDELGSALSLFGGDEGIFASHCAGPRDSELVDALPRTVIALSALHGTSTKIAFAGSLPFTAAGMAGTITANVQLTLVRKSCKAKAEKGVCAGFDVLE